MTSLVVIALGIVALAAAAAAVVAWVSVKRLRRELKAAPYPGLAVLADVRYRQILKECVERQPEHEREHTAKHGGGKFSASLRLHAVANRFARRIEAAGLPPLPLEERVRRAREALCR
jgi:hypothetical protein